MRKIKMVMIGGYGVGKSCLVRRYIENTYRPTESSTIGTAFHETLYFPKSAPPRAGEMTDVSFPYKVQLWDTAGAERYQSLAPMYMRGADVVVLVYDECVDSRKILKGLVKMIHEHAPTATLGLVLNKSDLPDNEPYNKIEEDIFPDFNFEASALTGDGVHEAFDRLLAHATAVQIERVRSNTINLDNPAYGSIPQADTPTPRRRFQCC